MNENISVSENDYNVTISDDVENVVEEQEVEQNEILDNSNVSDTFWKNEMENQEKMSEDSFDIFENVSGNVSIDDSLSNQDYTDIITEIKVLQDGVDSTNIALVSVNTFLSCIIFFIVFKWCEQKIKLFRKGFFKK